MLLELRPKRSTDSTACPSPGAGASPSSKRHSCRSPVEIRKSTPAAYADARRRGGEGPGEGAGAPRGGDAGGRRGRDQVYVPRTDVRERVAAGGPARAPAQTARRRWVAA